MNVLVEAATHDYVNLGDVAMLRVALRRLKDPWPDARFRVFTRVPERLAALCPGVEPVEYWARQFWFGEDLIGKVQNRLPEPARRGMRTIKETLRRRHPRLLQRWLRARLRRAGRSLPEWDRFLGALEESRVLVIAGAGGFTDHGRLWADSVLDLIEWAIRGGIPAVMVGQGFGPLKDLKLLARCRQMLPHVRWVFVREPGKSVQFLTDVGVPAERIVVTGDDAVETAWRLRPPALGSALGVNLRIFPSAGTDESLVESLRQPLSELCESLGCEAVSAPIFVPGDAIAIARALGLPEALPSEALATEEETVIRAIGRCRVVVTGAYHATVFAVSQGITAVCIAGSSYFVDKFEGLAAMFPTGGVVVVDAHSPRVQAELKAATEAAWAAAPQLRGGLLDEAAKQIQAGRAAYELLRGLLDERPRVTTPTN
jgi:colanic acid/amylovoran biosynthesis protein